MGRGKNLRSGKLCCGYGPIAVSFGAKNAGLEKLTLQMTSSDCDSNLPDYKDMMEVLFPQVKIEIALDDDTVNRKADLSFFDKTKK